MSSWKRIIDKVLTSKYNKPFPVTLLPSAIGAYVGLHFADKQAERQREILDEIRKLGKEEQAEVSRIVAGRSS